MNKKLLAVAVSGALIAPMAAQAIEYKISGHVNRMIRFADDGHGSDIQQTDNTASRSRFRFIGSADIGNGMKAGIRYEIGMGSNLSSGVRPKGGDSSDSFSGTSSDIRHSAIYFSGNWGKVTMGHTSEASDGIAFADNSGTGLVDEAATVEHCSSCAVRTERGAFTRFTLTNLRDSYDGGRNDLLRYDTPAFGPATVAVSVSNNERWAIGAYVDHAVGGGNLSVNGGYTSLNGGDEEIAFSASFLFSQGTSITGTYGWKDRQGSGNAGRNSDNWYVKLGHKWGNNAVSASYGETTDEAGNGIDGSSFGVGWVHTMKKPGIDIYAGYHHAMNDWNRNAAIREGFAPTTDLDDNDIFVVGSRIQFK